MDWYKADKKKDIYLILSFDDDPQRLYSFVCLFVLIEWMCSLQFKLSSTEIPKKQVWENFFSFYWHANIIPIIPLAPSQKIL